MRILLAAIVIILLTSHFAWALPSSYNITVSPSIIEFQVIDPMGNITGYDPNTRTVLRNIPNTIYLRRTDTGSEDTPLTKDEIYHEFDIKKYPIPVPITPGLHKIKLFGIGTLETYHLGIGVMYANMPLNYGATTGKDTIIYPNVTWTYEFDIPANPPANGQLFMVKVSNSNDLIIDITSAGNLGYIGNTKFVSELIKEVQEIEKERTEVQKQNDKDKEHLTPAQKAIKEYKELLKEITEKYQRPEGDEFVKQEAYTVLKEDLDYIINHIQ